MGETSGCDFHSGVTKEIESIQKWQEHHEKATHVRIENEIKDLQKRLPQWATFTLTGMGTIIGYLLALVKVRGL